MENGADEIQWLPNQLQAVLAQMVAVGPHCGSARGTADIMDVVHAQQETLKKEVEKYCMERSVAA